jgi:hypothetical protein
MHLLAPSITLQLTIERIACVLLGGEAAALHALGVAAADPVTMGNRKGALSSALPDSQDRRVDPRRVYSRSPFASRAASSFAISASSAVVDHCPYTFCVTATVK